MTVTSLQVPNQDARANSLKNSHYPQTLTSFYNSVTGNKVFTHMRAVSFLNYLLRLRMLELLRKYIICGDAEK